MSTTKTKHNNYIDLKAPLPFTASETETELANLNAQVLTIESQLEMAAVKQEQNGKEVDEIWRVKARTALRMTKARQGILQAHLNTFKAYQKSTITLEYALAFKESAERLFERDDLEDIYADVEQNYPHLKDAQ